VYKARACHQHGGHFESRPRTNEFRLNFSLWGTTRRAALQGHGVFIVVLNNSLDSNLTVTETCIVQCSARWSTHHLLSKRCPTSRAHTCAFCCNVKSATQQLGTRLVPQRLSADETAPIRTNGLHACVPPCSTLRNFRTRSERPHSLRRRTVTYSEVRRKFDRCADRASRETKMSERYCYNNNSCCCCCCYYYYYYYKNTWALRYVRMCRCFARLYGPYPKGVLEKSHLRNPPIYTGCVILKTCCLFWTVR
jgi:hypothetical protein